MADNPQIFSDKIRLAGVLIAKEMNMITHVNWLKLNIKTGQFIENRSNEYREWGWAWLNISELYDFLKDEYLNELKKEYKEIYDDLIEVMKNYNTPNGKVTYNDLLTAYDGILRLMQISQFHNVYREGDSGDFVQEES